MNSEHPGANWNGDIVVVSTHAGREFYAGSIYELRTPSPLRYGFSIETAARPEEQLLPEVVLGVQRQLTARFALGELGYVPRGATQEDAARGFDCETSRCLN